MSEAIGDSNPPQTFEEINSAVQQQFIDEQAIALPIPKVVSSGNRSGKITPVVYDQTKSPHVWREQASCRDLDTNLFFPPGDGPGSQERIEYAKKICGACVVREQCLDFALTTRQDVGIWGGMTEEERRRYRRTIMRRRN